jgi:hypothetical protein
MITGIQKTDSSTGMLIKRCYSGNTIFAQLPAENIKINNEEW